jgi:hypothetical protein
MVLSESAPQELSNEWSCQYGLTLKYLGQFLCPALALVTEVTISP